MKKIVVVVKRIIPEILVFLILLLIGLFISQNVGTFIDEGLERRTGIIALNEYVHIISPSMAEEIIEKTHIPRIYEHPDKYYGVVLQYPMLIIEQLLKLENTQTVWKFRHGFCFAVFVIGLICFYYFLRLQNMSKKISLITLSFILFIPRIFFESTYNIKDIGFLSLVFMLFYFGYRYYLNESKRDAFYFAIVTAFACGVRLIAAPLALLVIFLLFIKRMRARKINSTFIINIMLYIVATVGFLYFIYPGSWFDPLFFFPKAFTYMSHHPWSGNVLFQGSVIASNTLPWNYLPEWILITLPEFILGLFVLGAVFGIRIIQDLNQKLFFVAFLIYFVCTIFAVMIFKPNLYDGWRHFYFLFFFILYFASYGIFYIYIRFNNKRVILYSLSIVLSLNILWTAKIEFTQFPYGNVYFNLLAGNNPNKNFEVDYWGLSFLDAWIFINNENLKNEKKIYVSGNGPLSQSLELMPLSFQNKVALTNSQDEKGFHYFIWGGTSWSKSSGKLAISPHGVAIWNVSCYNI